MLLSCSRCSGALSSHWSLRPQLSFGLWTVSQRQAWVRRRAVGCDMASSPCRKAPHRFRRIATSTKSGLVLHVTRVGSAKQRLEIAAVRKRMRFLRDEAERAAAQRSLTSQSMIDACFCSQSFATLSVGFHYLQRDSAIVASVWHRQRRRMLSTTPRTTPRAHVRIMIIRQTRSCTQGCRAVAPCRSSNIARVWFKPNTALHASWATMYSDEEDGWSVGLRRQERKR